MEQRSKDLEVQQTLQSISEMVARILAEADADIVARRPECRSSGRCCRFDEWGHRLYVTTAELLHFLAVHVEGASGESKHDQQARGDDKVLSLPQILAGKDPGRCPFQDGTVCTAREARPLGCRVYFCDPGAASWQNDVYEKYHAKIRAVHEQFGLPYRYVEWRVGLRKWADNSGESMMEGLLTRRS